MFSKLIKDLPNGINMIYSIDIDQDVIQINNNRII